LWSVLGQLFFTNKFGLFNIYQAFTAPFIFLVKSLGRKKFNSFIEQMIPSSNIADGTEPWYHFK
ncbi:hypothetical protein, partial [Aquirufa nivalisilvae]